MIRIPCPFCGERDHAEFSYGKDASIQYPDLDAPMRDWVNAVFERENIAGNQLETWHHSSGCRMWLIVERDTTTHEIHSVRPAHPDWAQVLAAGRSSTEQDR
ncbi:MAG: Sarcosine oxidase subunit delta [Gammaproteobacteria bacterium]|nr:Sarcosine oxidase subunit delta [Gammaproteobacteria bacterium]